MQLHLTSSYLADLPVAAESLHIHDRDFNHFSPSSSFCFTSCHNLQPFAIWIPHSRKITKGRLPKVIMNPNLVSFSLWLAVLITAVSSNLVPRQSCSAGYTLCSPPGATSSETYDTSEGLQFLFLNILGTVELPAQGASPQPINPNGPAKRQAGTATMCCRYT